MSSHRQQTRIGPDRLFPFMLAGFLSVSFLLPMLPAGTATPAPRTVVLLTMDGVRWDYPTRDGLPAFEAMARDGARAERLTPPFPSLTFSSHATLATGLSPARHGIVANGFLDRSSGLRFSDGKEASWLIAPPLWVLAERAGLSAAVRSWPCSTGPWNGTSASYFQAYEGGEHDRETVRWILDLLHRPGRERPRLIMAWSKGADHAGHEEGPDSAGVRRAMRSADALLAELRAGLAALGPSAAIDLLVASDHGMARVDRMVDVVKVVPKEAFYPYIATSGPVCNIYVKTEAQRRAVAAGLGRLPRDVAVMTRAEAASRLGYDGGDRTGDFVLLCPPGATFASFQRKGDRDAPRGMHGYNPEVQEMGGIFYASGPGIARGQVLQRARAIDVAPTVCALLGIPPPPGAEGADLFGKGR